jgi:hypothetical protein
VDFSWAPFGFRTPLGRPVSSAPGSDPFFALLVLDCACRALLAAIVRACSNCSVRSSTTSFGEVAVDEGVVVDGGLGFTTCICIDSAVEE